MIIGKTTTHLQDLTRRWAEGPANFKHPSHLNIEEKLNSTEVFGLVSACVESPIIANPLHDKAFCSVANYFARL